MKRLQPTDAILMKMRRDYRLYLTMQAVFHPTDYPCGRRIIHRRIKNHSLATVEYDHAIARHFAECFGFEVGNVVIDMVGYFLHDQVVGSEAFVGCLCVQKCTY